MLQRSDVPDCCVIRRQLTQILFIHGLLTVLSVVDGFDECRVTVHVLLAAVLN